MLSHRFTRYIVGIGIITVFAVSFAGYKSYQNHIEFEGFMAQVVDFQENLNKDGAPLERKESEKLDNSLFPENQDSDLGKSLSPPVKVRVYSKGEITNIKVDRSKSPKIVPASKMVKQRVQTPDGENLLVFVPHGHELKTGDMLPETFFKQPLPPPSLESFNRTIRKVDIPEGEDAELYLLKLSYASAYGISVEEVEGMMENGQISTKVIERSVDEFSVDEFMDHDHLLQNSGDVEYSKKASRDAGNINSPGGISDDSQSKTSTLPRLNTVSSSEAVSGIPKMPNPPTVSHEGLLLERFDKGRQLIDQFGTEEGLRRFREMDPEAARQFEQERRSPPTREIPDETELSTQ